MAELFVYRINQGERLEPVLPALLGACARRRWRVGIQTDTRERAEALDTWLWVFDEASFIGHGCAWEDHAALQPVLLTDSEANVNNAEVRIVLGDVAFTGLADYRRVIRLFQAGDTPRRNAAAAEIEAARQSGFAVQIYIRSAEGKWQQAEDQGGI